MKILLVIFVFSFLQISYAVPVTKPPFPWAKLLQKFATPPTASPALSVTTSKPSAPPQIIFPDALFDDFLKQLTVHIKSKVGNETASENATTTTVAPSTNETEFGSTDPNNYEDALLREVYLDWGKRHTRQLDFAEEPQEAVETVAPSPNNYLPASPLLPQVPLTPGYPSLYPYGLFNPLAAFKMQKLYAQAQVDAAMAAMGITTTPKPTKVKLKFLLPAGSSLPAGLESFMVS